jgi:hypothetical protein
MPQHDPRAYDLTRPELVLCVLAVGMGVAAAAYFYWTVHWIAAAVITVYLWILLVDVCLTGRRSVTWYVLDFLHHLLSFAGTALIASYLWEMDWRVGTMAILPVFILLLAITGFLILRLYAMTPEGRVAQEARELRPEPSRMVRF